MGAVCRGGPVPPHPDPPQPYQPQNQPSCEPLESRTITADDCVFAFSFSTFTPAQAAAGYGYISLIIIAPSGTGTGGAVTGRVLNSPRFSLSHSYIRGEY